MRSLAAALLFLAYAGTVQAQAQAPEPADAFAGLALQFCAPTVSAGAEQIEAVAAQNRLALGEWREASAASERFEQWIRSSMRVAADKRIRFATLPGASGEDVVEAVIDEDARVCLVTGRGTLNVDVTLLNRLRDPAGDWQFVTTVEQNGSSIFEWPGLQGGSSVTLFHWPSQPGMVTRVLVERRNLPVAPRASQEATAAWVAHVVERCAVGIHERRTPTAEEFAPFMVLREVNERGSLVLESAPGQPVGTVIIDDDDSHCLISATGERARAIDAAIMALAAERGWPASERPRRVRLPKFLIAHAPDLRNGRDAYVSSGVIMGILLATVGNARN